MACRQAEWAKVHGWLVPLQGAMPHRVGIGRDVTSCSRAAALQVADKGCAVSGSVADFDANLGKGFAHPIEASVERRVAGGRCEAVAALKAQRRQDDRLGAPLSTAECEGREEPGSPAKAMTLADAQGRAPTERRLRCRTSASTSPVRASPSQRPLRRTLPPHRYGDRRASR
jgi:hypothetical protein